MPFPHLLKSLASGILSSADIEFNNGICDDVHEMELEASTAEQAFYTHFEEGYRQHLAGNLSSARALICSVRHFAPHFGWEVWRDQLLLNMAMEESDTVRQPLALTAAQTEDGIRAFEEAVTEADSLDILAIENLGLSRLHSERSELESYVDLGHICLWGGLRLTGMACQEALQKGQQIWSYSAEYAALLQHLPQDLWNAQAYEVTAIDGMMRNATTTEVLGHVNRWFSFVSQTEKEKQDALARLKSYEERGIQSLYDEFYRLIREGEVMIDDPQRQKMNYSEAELLAEALATVIPCSKTIMMHALSLNYMAFAANSGQIRVGATQTEMTQSGLRLRAVSRSDEAVSLAGDVSALDGEGIRSYGWIRAEMGEHLNDEISSEDTDQSRAIISQQAEQYVNDAISALTLCTQRHPEIGQAWADLAFARYYKGKILAHRTADDLAFKKAQLSVLPEIAAVCDLVLANPSLSNGVKAECLRAKGWCITEALNKSGPESFQADLGLMTEVARVIALVAKLENTRNGLQDAQWLIGKANYVMAKLMSGQAVVRAVEGYGDDMTDPCASVRNIADHTPQVAAYLTKAQRAFVKAFQFGADPAQVQRLIGHSYVLDRHFSEAIKTFAEASKDLNLEWRKEAQTGLKRASAMLACSDDESLEERCNNASRFKDLVEGEITFFEKEGDTQGLKASKEEKESAQNVMAYACEPTRVSIPNHSDYRKLWDIVKYLRWQLKGLQTSKVLEKLQPAELASTIYNFAGVTREIRDLALDDAQTADHMVKDISDVVKNLGPVFMEMTEKKALSRYLNDEFQLIQGVTNLKSDSLEILENNRNMYATLLAHLDELKNFTNITQLDPIPTGLRDKAQNGLSELDDRIKTLEQERGVSLSQLRANAAEHKHREEEALREKRRALVARKDTDEMWYRWYVDEVRGSHEKYTHPIFGTPNR